MAGLGLGVRSAVLVVLLVVPLGCLPQSGSSVVDRCASQVLELDDGSGFADWFFGDVSLPVEDLSRVELAELHPVFSFPQDTEPYPVSFLPLDYEVVLELRDNTGAGIMEVPLPISTGSTISNIMPPIVEYEEMFSVLVPDPPEYASFTIRQGSRELAAVERSANVPVVSVFGVCENQFVGKGDEIDISWIGEDLDGDQLAYRVLKSLDAGKTWEDSTFDNFKRTELSLASLFSWRGSDEARVAVVVSDGVNATVSVTPVFQVDQDGLA